MNNSYNKQSYVNNTNNNTYDSNINNIIDIDTNKNTNINSKNNNVSIIDKEYTVISEKKSWRSEVSEHILNLDSETPLGKSARRWKKNNWFKGMHKYFENVGKIIDVWNEHIHGIRVVNYSRFKKICEAVDFFAMDELISSIVTYGKVLNNPNCWYSYKFSPERFLDPGAGFVEKFLSSSERDFYKFNYHGDGPAANRKRLSGGENNAEDFGRGR